MYSAYGYAYGISNSEYVAFFAQNTFKKWINEKKSSNEFWIGVPVRSHRRAEFKAKQAFAV